MFSFLYTLQSGYNWPSLASSAAQLTLSIKHILNSKLYNNLKKEGAEISFAVFRLESTIKPDLWSPEKSAPGPWIFQIFSLPTAAPLR